MATFVKVSEYAQQQNVDRATVYRWIKNGDVAAKEIDGVLHVNVDGDVNEADATHETPVQQICDLKGLIDNLQTQLSQALETIDDMRQSHDKLIQQMQADLEASKERSDTIILQLTQQVDKITEQNQALTQQNQLLLEDLRPKRRWYHRLFAWNGT